MQKNNKGIIVTGSLYVIFIIFTVLVKTIDVQPIGPKLSAVGFAAINQSVLKFFGINLQWYNISSWLGYIAIAVAGGFAVFGLIQFIKRRSIRKVDERILLLGVFYILIFAAYVFFELLVVNYRPIILSEGLEASFPSSHTMLVICIMVTAIMQFHYYLREKKMWMWLAIIASALIIAVTVAGRLISGVHWFTDIVAGILLSSAFIALYDTSLKWIDIKSSSYKRKKKQKTTLAAADNILIQK